MIVYFPPPLFRGLSTRATTYPQFGRASAEWGAEEQRPEYSTTERRQQHHVAPKRKWNRMTVILPYPFHGENSLRWCFVIQKLERFDMRALTAAIQRPKLWVRCHIDVWPQVVRPFCLTLTSSSFGRHR